MHAFLGFSVYAVVCHTQEEFAGIHPPRPCWKTSSSSGARRNEKTNEAYLRGPRLTLECVHRSKHTHRCQDRLSQFHLSVASGTTSRNHRFSKSGPHRAESCRLFEMPPITQSKGHKEKPQNRSDQSILGIF